MSTEKKKESDMLENRFAWLAIIALCLTLVIAILGASMLYVLYHPEQFQKQEIVQQESTPDSSSVEIIDGKDLVTGFIAEGDYQLVKANCVSCHSSKLVLQNRATRSGWEEMIRWMQATQNLHDLGENEEKILDYLATYYAPKQEGRRKNLEISEWYVIE